MHTGWRIALIWACFVARLAFYAAMQPLWEGYDEYAHFSVIRTVAQQGRLLVPRDQPIQWDIAISFQLAPVPWELDYLPSPSVTHDEYWSLPAAERVQREATFRNLAAQGSRDGIGGMTAYEALQPPLYYWLMSPILRLMSQASLATQILILRWLSIAIASFLMPLVYRIAWAALGDERIALCCAATVAVMPGLAIDFARVGNECLGVVLFSLLTWLGLRQFQAGGNHRSFTVAAPQIPGYAQIPSDTNLSRARQQAVFLALGVVLGLGLLTKAYFLTAIPAMILLLLYVARKQRAYARASIPLVIAAAISGWWYWRNVMITGTLSGLNESVLLRDVNASTMLHRALGLPWATAVDAILFSHIYFGGWSSLMVRSWMYHVFYLVILIAVLGLLLAVRAPAMWWLIAVYLAFWAGQFYNVLLLYVSKGLPGSMGWYLYAVVAAEVVLCAAGLARIRSWLPAGGVVLFTLLDLYTVHAVAIPYYTGIIRHKANGAIAALHMADVQAVGPHSVFERLTAYKPVWITQPVLLTLWLAYLAATLGLAFTGVRAVTRHNDESFRLH